MTTPSVPFKRVLTPPKQQGGITTLGPDVKALKRVVSRSGNWPWQEFNQQYTNIFALGEKNKVGAAKKGLGGVVRLQNSLGFTGTGVWTEKTHEATLSLTVPQGLPHAGEFIWDQTSINQYNGYEDLTAAQKIVQDIFKWWQYLVTNDPAWHYLQQRPVFDLIKGYSPPLLPGYSDCSGTAIYCAWLGGAKSPDVHYGFSGYGNTDSLIDGGFQIAESEISKYAPNYYVLAFYGPHTWDTEHVTCVKSASEIFSHGQESDPRIYNTIHYRTDFLQVRAYPVI